MSMEYCPTCDNMIDLDYDSDHEHFQKNYKEAFYEKAHTKPFNLSEKIDLWDAVKDNKEDGFETISVKDVDEFIRLLKTVVEWKCGKNTDNHAFWNEQINRLAGEKFS